MVESNKYIHAVYDDDDTLLNAVKVLRENKCGIDEVYTPFPVHGLDTVSYTHLTLPTILLV